MKVFFLLFVLIATASAYARPVLSRLDCQASNGVSLSTVRPYFHTEAPVIVEAKWLRMSSTYFEARFEESNRTILLRDSKDSYSIFLSQIEDKTSAQNLTGSLWVSSSFFVALIYCTVELENI